MEPRGEQILSINYDLVSLITDPREDLSVEYKGWLDLRTNEHRAVLAKAAIALVNSGGGFIVLGFDEDADELRSVAPPPSAAGITQDNVNSAIRRFATPSFHLSLYTVEHPDTRVTHPILKVPQTLPEPVMSKRDCEGVISQARCYIRKPGPRSEEPHTPEEWRGLLQRCLRAGRDDMLEAIRSIVTGRIQDAQASASEKDLLEEFCETAYTRWKELAATLPPDADARFPHGFYEMAFSLIGAQPARDLVELQDRLSAARRVKLTGWTPFLDMSTPEWQPYPVDDFIEAWIGRDARDRAQRTAAHSDFWRAGMPGKLYTIRGYSEDSTSRLSPGTAIDATLPIWRVAEATKFAARLADTFPDTEAIAIRCRFTGLNGRALVSLSGRRAFFGDRFSRSDETLMRTQATIQQLNDNFAEVIQQLLKPLYEKFSFFELPMSLVEEELEELLHNRF